MEVQEGLETFQFGEKFYVLTRTAARYLHMSHDRLQGQIAAGRVKCEVFGSRRFIEFEVLKAYATKMELETSGWSRIDAFLGREVKR